jgi:hypothetical protein
VELLERELTISEADLCMEKRQAAKAFEKYSHAYIELINYFNNAKFIRKIAKGSGWVVAFFTGGFGWEDFIIVPLVNNAVLKLFKLDIKELARYLSYILRQKLSCIILDENLTGKLNKSLVFCDFLLAYKLLEKSIIPKDIVKSVFELVNPMADENSNVFSVEPRLSEPVLTDELLKYSNKTDLENKRIHVLLFSYLDKSGERNNILYHNFLQKGYQGADSSNYQAV